MFLTVDGGGTKLVAACFDEELNVIARGRSGGVNRTQNDAASVLRHVDECLSQVLQGITEIEEVFVVFVGDLAMFEQQLRSRVKVGKITSFDEPRAGLLAGAGKEYGLLALAGTGSDVFWIRPDKRCSLGGWGPVLGDQGSGTWMGLQALRAACREINSWGEPTRLTQLIKDRFNGWDNPWNIVNAVYETPAPFPVAARLTPLIGQAAREGDKVALDILRKAGEAMAIQMKALFRRDGMPEDPEITLCGGAWKCHPEMLASFRAHMQADYPSCHVHRPWFEHMAAGPMHLLLRQGIDRHEARKIIASKFTQEIISQED